MKIMTLVILSHFAADYHGGHTSKGYRLLSRCLKALRRKGIEYPLDLRLNGEGKRRYETLVRTYAAKIADRA